MCSTTLPLSVQFTATKCMITSTLHYGAYSENGRNSWQRGSWQNLSYVKSFVRTIRNLYSLYKDVNKRCHTLICIAVLRRLNQVRIPTVITLFGWFVVGHQVKRRFFWACGGSEFLRLPLPHERRETGHCFFFNW